VTTKKWNYHLLKLAGFDITRNVLIGLYQDWGKLTLTQFNLEDYNVEVPENINFNQGADFEEFLQDTDGDGLPDTMEEYLLTDPNNPDTDGDGVLDGAEFEAGTNPLEAN